MESIRRPIDLVMAISALVSLSFIAQAADQGQEPEKSRIEPPYFEVPKDHTAMHRAVAEADRGRADRPTERRVGNRLGLGQGNPDAAQRARHRDG